MAPDFEYFIMLEPYSSIGHSILGLVLQAIPLSILFAFIFHYIVKEQLAIHMPSIFSLNRRAYNILGEWKLQNQKDWMIFVLSVVIGFISHVTIDAFTHVHGYFVVHFSILRELLFFGLPVFKALQHSLSLLGLLVTFVVIINQLYRSSLISNKALDVTTKQKILYWLSVMSFSIVVTGVKLVFTSSNNIIGILVVAPISGLLLGFILTSLIMRVVRIK